MSGEYRLNGEQISKFLADCPDEACDIVLELRKVVLKAAPSVYEAIRFGTLCYFKPDHPYGAIGGNVCMIDGRKGFVELAFIHGASLTDPGRLLRGSGKAKRHIRICSVADARRPAVHALIRAAVAYSPLDEGKES